MLKIRELYDILDGIAPFSLSQKCIDRGDYDNSGIIINSHERVEKILFTLDLSVESVKRAKREKADTIITHHPAIYSSVKSLSVEDGYTAPILMAIENKMNVISLHLNLDNAVGGIDHSLAMALGAKTPIILDDMGDGTGYGREFEIEETSLSDFAKTVKKTFQTDKVLTYGKGSQTVTGVASFCGAGSSHAIGIFNKGLAKAEVIVTSDMPHHVLKEFIEMGKKIVILPHYIAEEYGFKIFFQMVAEKLSSASVVYFDDKRFR